jgi:hypothetical protein
MDPTLQAKIDEAKAAGYTDDEIAAFMRGQQGTPVPVQEEPSRAAEVTAAVVPTALGAVPEIAGTAALGYGLYKYGPQLAQTGGNIISKMAAMRSGGGAAPPPPTIGTAANPIGSAPSGSAMRVPITNMTPGPVNMPVSGPVAPTTSAGRAFSPQAQEYMAQRAAQTAPQMAPQTSSMSQQVQKMAFQRLAPVANMARAAAPAAIGISGLTYSPSLNTGEDEEMRRRRMMPPTITR